MARTYHPVPENTAALYIEDTEAGSPVQFSIQTRDQFNHDVNIQQGYQAIFTAKVVLDHEDIFMDIAYAGGGIYTAVTPKALNVSGTYYASVVVNFRISNAYVRYTGLQIGGSPYQVRVIASVMDFSKTIIDGKGIKTARQGVRASFAGNRITIVSRDRFGNICPSIGNQHFGINVSWPELEAEIAPSYSQDGIYELDYWVPGARYHGTLRVCEVSPPVVNSSDPLPDGWSVGVSVHTGATLYTHLETGAVSREFPAVPTVGRCSDDDFAFEFEIYVLPFAFWMYNGPQLFDARTSEIFATTGCPAYDAANILRRRMWDGVDVDTQVTAPNTIPEFVVPACEQAQAGTPYSFYLQQRDEFGQMLTDPVEHWNRTHITTQPANELFKAQTYTKSVAEHAHVEYYRSGIYRITMNFTRAGSQPVHVTAAGHGGSYHVNAIPSQVALLHSPFQVLVAPGPLSSRESYADGDATVMAQEGTRNSLEAGNILWIHALDRFRNVRMDGSDSFALDPLTLSAFSCDMAYIGNGIYEARFWWEVQYVQTYEICPRRPEDPVGAFDVCLSRCDRMDCMSDGLPDNRRLQLVTVFIRPNEGSPFSAPDHSHTVCMNDWSDVYACAMYTGAAGVQSSFSIEAKNELDFPNYRGFDFYVAILTGPGDIPPVESTYLRIQFYELVYVPYQAGTYEMNLYMCDHGELWDPDVEDIQVEVEGYICNPLTVGNSPYTVVVNPGSASPVHSTYRMPSSFNVGEPNFVHASVQDAYSNAVFLEDALNQLHVFAQLCLDDGCSTIAEERTEFVVEQANSTLGAVRTDLDLLVAGPYMLILEVWLADLQGVVTHHDIALSPNQIFVNPGAFSIRHTEILNYNKGGVTHVITGNELFMEIHSMDEYGNPVARDGLNIEVATFPAGITVFVVSGEGGGAYRCPYRAPIAGEFLVYMELTENGERVSNIIGSPYELVMEPGPASRTIVTGSGLSAAVAGGSAEFQVELRDQFGNTRADVDSLRVLLRYERDWEGSDGTSDGDVSLSLMNLDPTQTTDREEWPWTPTYEYEDGYPGIGRLEYYGDYENPDFAGFGDPSLAGRYGAVYTAFTSGTFRPVFFSGENELSGSSSPYSIQFGVFYSGLSTAFDQTNGATVLGVAGEPIQFEFQLRDAYGNRRLVDDAEVIIIVQESTSGSFNEQEATKTSEYTANGAYTITVQIDASGPFRVVMACSDVNNNIESVLAIDDDFNGQSQGIDFFIESAAATAAQTSAAMERDIVAGLSSNFNIDLEDRFGNDNRWESNLQWQLLMTGPASFEGLVTWDNSTRRYGAEYLPEKSGVYAMTLSIVRSADASEQISGSPFQIVVRAADVVADHSIANGLGVIRVDPGYLDEDDSIPYDPAGTMPAVFLLQARDRFDNPVTPADVPAGEPATEARMSIELIHDCTVPDDIGSNMADWAAKGCLTATTEVSLGCGVTPTIDASAANGNFEVSYTLDYDDPSNVDIIDGLGGTVCGGHTVDYAQVYYRIKVMIDGQNILLSPMRLRIGRYEAPSHQPYICEADGTPRYDEVGEGRDMVRAPNLQLDVLAGQEFVVLFQNVFREGEPGCQNQECEITVDDNTEEQIDTLQKAVAEFTLESYRLDESFLDLGEQWEQSITRPFNEMRGRYAVTVILKQVPIEDGTFAGGGYLLGVVAGGEFIDGTPFEVFVRPAEAHAPSSMPSGPGLVATEVDVESTYTVVVRDQYLNVRPSGDTVGLEWATDADPRMSGVASDAILESVAQYSCTGGDDGNGGQCTLNGAGNGCAVDGGECVLAQLPPEYTQTYTVEMFSGTVASFYLLVNGARSSATIPYRVPCTPAPISATMTMLVGRTAVTGGDILTAPGALVAGQSETILIQAKDSYGNLKFEGGDLDFLTIGIQTSENELEPAVTDRHDGTYRLRYTVTEALDHSISILVNADAIPNSPFTTSVEPAELSPANCELIAEREQEVGSDVTIEVEQRDLFGNPIGRVPAGVFSAVLGGVDFAASPLNRYHILVSTTLSGVQFISVYYQEPGQARMPVGLNSKPDGVEISFTPQPAVPENTILNSGFLRTQDCIAGIPAVFGLQSRDQFYNDCVESVEDGGWFDGANVHSWAAGQDYRAVLSRCDPPGDENCGGLMSNSDVQATIINPSDGSYLVNYTVQTTGYYQLVVMFNNQALALPGASLSRNPVSYVVLSDTAAVPALCQASGPGLTQAVAGQAASVTITARGQTAAGEVVVRQGSGDEFVTTISGEAFLELDESGAELTHLEYIIDDAITGQYSLVYTATSANHSTASWFFTINIRLNGLPIEGMPMEVTMVSGPTAAAHMFAEGQSISDAVAGEPARFTVTGRDAYNNKVTECVAFDYIESKAEVSGNHSNLGTPTGPVLVTVFTTGCDDAVYHMAYDMQLASQRWQLHVLYQGSPILRSPFQLEVQSGLVAAATSYVSKFPGLDAVVATVTGEFDIGTAGEHMTLYYHAYDSLGNRLTVPACAGGTTDCLDLILNWCQLSRDVSIMTALGLMECEAATEVQFTVERAHEEGVLGSIYSVTFMLTRSGTYSLTGGVVEASGDEVEFGTHHQGVAFEPAVAAASHTIANPSTTAVAEEEVRFVLRARDEFDNFVDNGNQSFSLVFTFVRGGTNEIIDGVQWWTDDEGQPFEQRPTEITFSTLSRQYEAMYQVTCGGAATGVEIEVFLDDEMIWDAPIAVNVRAAQNIAGLCYIMNNVTGPAEQRERDLSRDLKNLDWKKAGEDLTLSIQSMGKTGPRAGYVMCTPEQAAILNAGDVLPDDQSCEMLDEFTLFAVTLDDRQYEPNEGQGYGENCATTQCVVDQGLCEDNQRSGCCQDRLTLASEWEENDCARLGEYGLTWRTEVSGTYQINVLSFGIQIQNEAVQADRGQELTATFGDTRYQFDTFMPFEVYIYPAEMDAARSSAFVAPTMERNLPSTVTVIGRDRFGNLLDRDGGEWAGLGALIQPLCIGQSSATSTDFRYDNSETVASTGQFVAPLVPRFGGPSIVQVYYDPTRTSAFDDGSLVGEELPTVVKLDIGRPSPNTGHLDGGTIVKVPVYGACDWGDVNNTLEWQPSFSCTTRLADGSAQVTKLGRLSPGEEVEENVRLQISGSSGAGVSWELRRIGGMYPGQEDRTVLSGGLRGEDILRLNNEMQAESAFTTAMDVELGRGADGDSECQGPCAWSERRFVGWDREDIFTEMTKESTDLSALVLGGRYFARGGTCVRVLHERQELRIVPCIQSPEQYPDGPLHVDQLLGLPSGEYELVAHNVSTSDIRIDIIAELDSPTLSHRNVSLAPREWREGQWDEPEATSVFSFTLGTVRAVVCEETPSRPDILGALDKRQTAQLEVGTRYNTTVELFHETLWYNPLMVYPSSSFEYFYYYPHPVVATVRPIESSYMDNVTEHLSEFGYQLVYASTSGGMPISVLGSEFDAGEDADTNRIVCVFLNKGCMYSNESGWWDRPNCSRSETFTGTNGEWPAATGDDGTFHLWTRGTYIHDGRIDCAVPDFAEFTGDVVLEVSLNWQDIGSKIWQRGLHFVDGEVHCGPRCRPSSTWVKVYDLERVLPQVSALAGGIDIVVELDNADPHMLGMCRFASFTRGDGSVGLPLEYATRLTDTSLKCVVPNVGRAGIDCLETPEGCGEERSLANVLSDFTVSFDQGLTFCRLQPFFFYAQPDVNSLIPLVGPTSGGTKLRMEMRAGEKYNFMEADGTVKTVAGDYTQGAEQFVPRCLFKNNNNRIRDPDAIMTQGLFEFETRIFLDDFQLHAQNFEREFRPGPVDASLPGNGAGHCHPYGGIMSEADFRARPEECTSCSGQWWSGAGYQNITWGPGTPGCLACQRLILSACEKEEVDNPNRVEFCQQQLSSNDCVEDCTVFPHTDPFYEAPCHDRYATYTSQQVVCNTPSNPTPGAAYYVDVSLDDGATFSYESSNSVPKSFGYYADVAIITMDANDQYNAANEFRTAINNGDAVVDVRFAYSCGYSSQYERTVRCQFGDMENGTTTKAREESLQFGADVTNQVGCFVPLGAHPDTTTIRIALNGVDFTDITTQTEFTYYGTPQKLHSSYVTSVWLMDEQRQFTTAAAESTEVKTVVTRLVDETNNYVNTHDLFDAKAVEMVMTHRDGRNIKLIYSERSELRSGSVAFEGIRLRKPKSGGTYYIRVSLTDPLVDPVCPAGHAERVRLHTVSTGGEAYPYAQEWNWRVCTDEEAALPREGPGVSPPYRPECKVQREAPPSSFCRTIYNTSGTCQTAPPGYYTCTESETSSSNTEPQPPDTVCGPLDRDPQDIPLDVRGDLVLQPQWTGAVPHGEHQIGCIEPAVIEMNIIVGPTSVKNSVIVDGTGGTTPPDMFINPGSPFTLTVQARDSADNDRIDGGDLFTIWATLRGNTSEAMFFNPQFNNHITTDNEDGTYRLDALVRADFQRDDNMQPIRIWGEYDIFVQGFNESGQLEHVLGSPVMQIDNSKTDGMCIGGQANVDSAASTRQAIEDLETSYEWGGSGGICERGCICVGSHRCNGQYDPTLYMATPDCTSMVDDDGDAFAYVPPRIDPVDCTLNGQLEGASPTNAGDSCICDKGYQRADDQSRTGGSHQHVVCEICPRTYYKTEAGNERKCEKCPISTHTVEPGATTPELCVCEEDHFRWYHPERDILNGGDIDFSVTQRDGAFQSYCINQDFHGMVKPSTNFICTPCPPCVKCYGNDTIAVAPGYWSDTINPYIAYYCIVPTGDAKDMCIGGQIHTQKIFDIAALPGSSGPQITYRAVTAGFRNPGDMAEDNLCDDGGTGPTCANCGLGYKKDKKSGKCQVCPKWKGWDGIDWQELTLAIMCAVGVGLVAQKLMVMAKPEDIVKGKILISFGQVLQSFAKTYSVQWPAELKAFLAHFDILNFDIFSIGSLECEFPGVKNFYTRFWCVVVMPIGVIVLCFVMYKSKMKAVHLMRKTDYDKSRLEVQIEDIEIMGTYISRVMALMIFMYLKVSQTTLDMFSCRKFAPSQTYDGPSDDTDRSYLLIDLKLSCLDATYTFNFSAALFCVFLYPIGIPFIFGFLLFKQRDQIHDAINKMKYGFLFKDYALTYFFWEIFDLMRKISLSGALVFFNPGSLAQIITALLIGLGAFEIQMRVMPYDNQTANYVQALSFFCIFMTLFGALLMKVNIDPATDPGLGPSFCNTFLVLVNSMMPILCVYLTAYSIAYDFYMTSLGQKIKSVAEAGHRRTLGEMQAKAEKNANKENILAKHLVHGRFGVVGQIKWAISKFWKRADVEPYLLAEELDQVRERREQRDQARILLAEAKLAMHEKREWLRFLQKNSKDNEEFHTLMTTESIDIYKRLILKMEVAEDKSEIWGDFVGEDLEEAYENPVFQRRYKLSDALLTVEELERQVRSEFQLVR